MASVRVVGGAGALARDHGGAERGERRAFLPEGGTFARLLDSAQNLAADADLRLVGLDVLHLEAALGVVVAVLPAQPVAALRDGSHAAPLAVANLEDVVDERARSRIALRPYRAPVGDLHFGAPGFELLHRAQDGIEQIERLESGDDQRDAIMPRDRLVLRGAHHGADVTGTEERLDSITRRLQDGRDRGRREDVGNEYRKICEPAL